MGSIVLTAAAIAWALQAGQARVVGSVRDAESGDPIPGAVVTLTDLERAAITDSNGGYAFVGVPGGPQHVMVRSIGYAARTLHALVPRAGELRINVALPPDPVALDAIDVRLPIPVRGAESGDSTLFPDRGISAAAVRTHPLLAEPDVFQALSGGEVVLSPESPSGVHLRGGSSDQTAYTLDGIPIFSPYHAAGVFSAWNPDALSRLYVSSSSPSPDLPDALSGTVVGSTRTPGSQFRVLGGVSTKQVRATVDGPLGWAGASYLLSLRSGFPAGVAPRNEPSYVRGETGDWLTRIELPVLRGTLRFLAYASENEVDAAQDTAGAKPGRNVFEWQSRSLGAEWTRSIASVVFRLRGWSATGDAAASWTGENGLPADLAAARRDQGVLAEIEYAGSGARTVAGVRMERSRTSYLVEAESSGRPPLALTARTPVATAFIQHARRISRRTEFDLMAPVAMAAGDVYVGPRVQLRWTPVAPLTLTASYARLHQFAQSLRNTESVAGNIFPADLHLGAGATTVPVARSNQGVLAADYRPTAGVRLGAQLWVRELNGLVLVAPRSGEPFATQAFAVGSGAASGASLDAAMAGSRYGVVASYGWQRVRLTHDESTYVPQHAAAHILEAGAILFPAATFSIRLGATGALGRRTTAVRGALEWEACNLLDRGCEFGGSPSTAGQPPGATKLPAYLRLDLGVRKHWHVKMAGGDAQLAWFATVTNLLGRLNVLTVAADPWTREPVQIQMRPRAPLVIGLDWAF